MAFELTSSGIKDGIIHQKYGRLGPETIQGIPQLSIPLSWIDPPEGTKSFALICIDYDNYEDEGFAWLHWSVANIPVHIQALPENCTHRIETVDEHIIQGKTTWVSEMDPESPECNRYGGPAPEKRSHEYEFHLFAVNKFLELDNGYYHNRLRKVLEGHILGEAILKGEYLVSEKE